MKLLRLLTIVTFSTLISLPATAGSPESGIMSQERHVAQFDQGSVIKVQLDMACLFPNDNKMISCRSAWSDAGALTS